MDKVITAYQLQARLVSNIAAHDAETDVMTARLSGAGENRAAQIVDRAREKQIALNRDALSIIIDLIEIMESEQAEAEVGP